MTIESRWAHAETWTQMIVGTAIVQPVLWVFDISFRTAMGLNMTILVLSYIRTYLIRRAFAWLRMRWFVRYYPEWIVEERHKRTKESIQE